LTFRTDLLDNAAALALQVCQQFGAQAYYGNKAVANVTIWLAPDTVTRDSGEAVGAEADLTTQRFFIPKQTSFPPADGIQINDTITYPTTAAYKYIITRWEGDGVGAGFTVDTVRTKPTRLA
jgi:hypothetical protein